MAEGAPTFSDPDSYTAVFGSMTIKITIVGGSDFRARMTRLKLQNIEVNWFAEDLPRIAYISLPLDRIVLTFPVGATTHHVAGFHLQKGDIVFHSLGGRVHQRSEGAFEWGLISLSAARLVDCSKALHGRPILPPQASVVLRPSRTQALRFRTLLKQARHLADTKPKLVGHTEVARALEQEMLYALSHHLTAKAAQDHRKRRQRHAAVMVRFEELLRKRIDQKLSMAQLCGELGVPERTLRMCCHEFLGLSPTRYILLQRLNRARAALQRADPSTASVAKVARNHHFMELGRFSVTYRSIFGESPSATLHRGARA